MELKSLKGADAMGTTLCGQERVNLATDQLAAISRLFSSSVVREMARKGKSPLFARLVTQSQLFGSISLSKRVYAIFDTAFSLLQREGYRHEYIYKAVVSPKSAPCKVTATTAPVSRLTACSALWARCVLPSFIFAMRES